MPRRLPRNFKRGDFQTCCAYCGALFYRSALVRKENGLLACRKDCAKGRDEVQLSRLNAEYAAQVVKNTHEYDGGRNDTRDLPTIQRTTAADILRYTDDDV
jgi:hypothetical protein